MASGGYPGDYAKGKVISGLDAAAKLPGVTVFHAGTKAGAGGGIVTDGGRVLGVTALGDGIEGAVKRAYEAVAQIRFDGMQYRRDIAARALRAKQEQRT
jgi:phosphoribosylamine--glycine ligase